MVQQGLIVNTETVEVSVYDQTAHQSNQPDQLQHSRKQSTLMITI